jgi:hypothetical protein
MTENESTEIVPLEPVQPLMSPEAAAQAWNVFLELKKRLLSSSDYQRIGDTKFIRKSGFRKLSVVFNLSDEIVEQEKVEREDRSFYWRIVTITTAPNGRTSTGVGICDSNERNFAHLEHDVYSTAHTRAKNRAISDMVAGGVVSAEEMSNTTPPRTKKAPTKKTQTKTAVRMDKRALDEIELKKSWTWDKVFKTYNVEIQERQEQLGGLWSFESAAVVFAREKGLVVKETKP